MLHKRKKINLRLGVAAVEFAVVLPLMFFLLMGMWEIGRVIQIRQSVMGAAREAGRQAAAGRPPAEIPNVVIEYLSHAGLPTANVQVEIDSNWTLPSGELGHSVAVSVPVRDFRWVAFHYFTGSADIITVQTVWPRS